MKLHTTTNRNASLEKASRVLSAFSEDTPELGVMDLARRVGLNKSTASRFVSTLTQLGLLERTEGGRKVRLSLRLFELGMRAARNRPLVAEAQVVLQRLGEQARETAWLATPADGDVVFVTRLAGSREASVIETGRRYPGRGGALGRLFAAAAPSADAEGSPKLIDHVPEVLVDHGDLIDGVTFVAGGVFDRTGRLVGAIGIACAAGPAATAAHVPLVRRASAELSRRLGFLRTSELTDDSRLEPSQKIA
ncbi:MAG: helix-turn-helix domain-containing protein [Candidatus Binatia bacterium]|nr:helix-turn-helix domain-containing protein [Candidatus Binatia bacterium]